MDHSEISLEEQRQLLSELENLLKEQIELAHQGRISGVEKLSVEADRLVREIARAGMLGLTELQKRQEHLQKSYEDLRLVLTAQKADVSRELRRIRKGKKVIGVYRNSI